MISNTVNPKGMSPSRMRHVTVLLVFSLKLTHVKMKGPDKSIQPQPQPQPQILGDNMVKFDLTKMIIACYKIMCLHSSKCSLKIFCQKCFTRKSCIL